MDEYIKSQYAQQASEQSDDIDEKPADDYDTLIDSEEIPDYNPEEDSEAEPEASSESEEDANDQTFKAERKPYSERYYLLFGGETVPSTLDLAGTRELLTKLGFSNSSLKQARKGKDISNQIERKYSANRSSAHQCDFCGKELLGTEYESLADGRIRCKLCARTAVKDQTEFENIYRSVKRNMEMFFGVKIKVPIDIRMVNAQKLHNQIGKVFVPTPGLTNRTIGLAIKEKDGSYHILMENGAPRMQSITTMVHEMTHIWQYTNWNPVQICSLYGKEAELQIYEGMARWAEIQYTYLINEFSEAKRMEITTSTETNAYGVGFRKYVSVYPLVENTVFLTSTPFMNPNHPL